MKTAIITGASSGLGREFARQLTDIFPEIECCWLIARREDRLEEILERPLDSEIHPFNPDKIKLTAGSTDVGDVSWNCPTAQAYVATWAAGTPGHSWQVVSQGKSGLAHKGLIYAAKAMAGAAVDMIEDPEIIKEAWAEMEETLEGDTYHCPIPDGCKPRAIGMTK